MEKKSQILEILGDGSWHDREQLSAQLGISGSELEAQLDSLRRSHPAGGFNNLSTADRYIPTYLYLLMQLYVEEGGDLNALHEQLLDQGIDLNDIQNYIATQK